MYAGTTLGHRSGNVIGAHQKIDRLARRQLTPLLKEGQYFPSQKDILYFEGDKGPDGVKRKSPSIDEPWHFIDPTKDHDHSLIAMINDHLKNLASALREDNHHRASFEAAWAAHAIVDGLTPAHHFPLADKIEELFGIPHHERISVKEKNIIKGINRRDTISKNWEYWGGGGIFSSHAFFELGVSMAMFGKDYKSLITEQDITNVKLLGYEAVFRECLQEIVDLDVYELYRKVGWNVRVVRIVHKKLIPIIIKAVVLGWYFSLYESELQ